MRCSPPQAAFAPMKTPKRILPLVTEGLVDEVVRQLMSGKEATVYIVRCGEHIRCAKVYKDANQRSFRNSTSYQEGRKTKNSRQARAMAKGSRYGRQMQEEAWQNAEVDALYRLAAAGVRVPQPYLCSDGVLLMDLVTDDEGQPAPRLNDLELSPETALLYHAELVQQVVRMLCAGIIHGDLSEFNILVGRDGPVIIDLPQAVDAAGNNNAEAMLERDVNNLASYFGRFVPALLSTQYGKEIWQLYIAGHLTPEMPLTGQIAAIEGTVDVADVLEVVHSARLDEENRLLYQS
jgi:RIO kinase 1